MLLVLCSQALPKNLELSCTGHCPSTHLGCCLGLRGEDKGSRRSALLGVQVSSATSRKVFLDLPCPLVLLPKNGIKAMPPSELAFLSQCPDAELRGAFLSGSLATKAGSSSSRRWMPASTARLGAGTSLLAVLLREPAQHCGPATPLGPGCLQ